MFNKEQLTIIHSLLNNLNFKTPEIDFAIKVREIVKICEKEIQPVKDGGK